MTKKHFQLFADAIKAIDNAREAKRTAHNAAEVFKAENSRFDSARFFKACGLDENGTTRLFKASMLDENEQKPTPKKLNRQSRAHRAQEILTACNVEIGADFHTLHSNTVDALLEFATQERYRKPRNANGSRARCYHDRLQRLASKSDEKGCEDLSRALGRLI